MVAVVDRRSANFYDNLAGARLRHISFDHFKVLDAEPGQLHDLHNCSPDGFTA